MRAGADRGCPGPPWGYHGDSELHWLHPRNRGQEDRRGEGSKIQDRDDLAGHKQGRDKGQEGTGPPLRPCGGLRAQGWRAKTLRSIYINCKELILENTWEIIPFCFLDNSKFFRQRSRL